MRFSPDGRSIAYASSARRRKRRKLSLLVRILASGVCHSDLDIDATEREAVLPAGALAATVLGP